MSVGVGRAYDGYMRFVGPVIATFVTLTGNPSRAESPKAKPVDPCSAQALKLGDASPLVEWKPPPGCTSKTHTSVVFRAKAALDAQFDCTKGTALAVDLTKYVLIQISQTMQPAAIGLDAFEDGKVLTLVTRFRTPCPKDRYTMSRSMTAWFLMPRVPSWGDRRLDRASCTIELKCP
jgi:hypothetical protein